MRKYNPGRNAVLLSTVCTTIVTTMLCSNQPCEARKLFGLGSDGKKEAAVEVTSAKRKDNKTFVTGKTLINAPAEIVWQTVHEERQKDPDIEYSKVLEQHDNHCRLEQKFKLIPIIGTAVCQMHNSEVALERIDYKLISSDRFKAMEGSWVLSPGADKNFTYLELSTHLDLGLPVPSAMMTSVTSTKLKKRLGNVKKMAEKTQRTLAAKQAANLR
ncbi:MAG: hypothetical protein K8L99_21005 [Anaerolineae bacterium]|nr:hypothetical protein [Anaerolineae bacterium]